MPFDSLSCSRMLRHPILLVPIFIQSSSTRSIIGHIRENLSSSTQATPQLERMILRVLTNRLPFNGLHECTRLDNPLCFYPRSNKRHLYMPDRMQRKLSHIMKIEEADSTNTIRASVHESKMARRRAIGFLAGTALSAVAMLYFGFLSSPRVSADSNSDNSTSTSQSSTTTEESSTTTGRPSSGGW